MSGSQRYGGLDPGLPLMKHMVKQRSGRIKASSEGAVRGFIFIATLQGFGCDQATVACSHSRCSSSPHSSRLRSGDPYMKWLNRAKKEMTADNRRCLSRKLYQRDIDIRQEKE